MNKDELRELLHQEYKTENWKKVTEFVFPNVQYLQRPQAIPFSNDKVESFKQIGNVKLNDGKNLAMFEVKVAKNVNLARNRVELRKLVENLIDKERNHGVLVIYEQGKEDYRFTFTAKSTEFDEEENDFVDLETDAKRFTYILGKNESCKTAANRFWELSTHKDTATIKDVENAFSVERLNKEFFNKYKEFYEDFVQYITGKRFVKEKGKWVEKKIGQAKPIHKEVFDSDDKLARNFVKLLLGRLVFIQFLQKKGWMGVPATSKQWKNGDSDFLLNLYNNAKSKDEFHSKYLYLLFYKAFNTPDRSNDVFFLTGSRVPYLNGGLFENENPKTKEIDFPDTYFANLLDFFSQYNFTIDENDPLDHEVGIDPEMLGHIFENLLEDNKDKGAFYTPKPIVQYMCQESLIQYLKTYLQEHQLWPEDEEAANQTETNLQNFVRKKIAGELLNDYDEHLARALKEVKICDPAIGSGAFPMGLLNEIFHCMQVLHDASPDSVGAVWEMEEWAPDIVKKNIIQHSIYGVDIEKGAVDIARLRFWLSLIVDEQEPTPLPNLDFKIMQGNSLLESYEEIDLSNIVGTKTVETEVARDLFGNPINIQSSIFDTKITDNNKITELIDYYFNTQEPEQKQRLKKEIDSIIHNVLDECIKHDENKILIKITNIKNGLSHLKLDKNHSTIVAAKTTKARVKLTKELENAQDELEHLKTKRKELHDLQKTAERPYFLWHLYFKDVFDKGGFDIVIANPPYVNIELLDDNFKKQLFKHYKFTQGRTDIYIGFLEIAISQLMIPKGILSYIIPYAFTNQNYGSLIREEIAKKHTIKEIVDASSFYIFENASVKNITLSIINEVKSTNETVIKRPLSLSNFVKNDFYKHTVPQSEFLKLNNVRFETKEFLDLIDLRKAIEVISIKLEDICLVAYGVRVNHKTDVKKPKASYIHNTAKSTYKPFIEGKDIERYHHTQTGWLDYRPKEHYNAMFPELFESNKLMFINVVSEKLRFTYDDKGLYNSHTVINCVRIDSLTSASHPSAKKILKESNINVAKKYDLKCLLGIVNSKLLNWYFVNFLSEGLHFYPDDAKKFPIINNIDKVYEVAIINRVKEIIKLKQKNVNTDVLEREIDIIIFRLYNIEYKHLTIIDTELLISEQDYQNYRIS